MEPFREDNNKLVQIGNDDVGKRVSSDAIQERLRVLYTSRFDIRS